LAAFAALPLTAQEAQPAPAEETQQETVEPRVPDEPAAEVPVTETEVVPFEEAPGGAAELTPDEEAQIDRAIEEAMGGQATQQEASGTLEEEWDDQYAPGREEAVLLNEGVREEPREEPRSNYGGRREVQTLMTGSGGYGAIDFGYTQINELHALQMGARAAWIVGHGFGLGIAGTGFTTDFTPVGENYYAISGGYGGLLLEPIIMGWFPVNIALPVVIGGGGLASYATNADPWEYDNLDPTFGEYSTFFVAEAGVELQFNLVRFFRLTLFGNYRWTTNLDMKPMYGLVAPSPYYVGQDALRGWSAGVRFKFGSF